MGRVGPRRRENLLSQGQRINEALIVDRGLGEGSFAEVYRVRHQFLGWQALKLFRNMASREEASDMMEEARILSTLGHPNIIRVFDAGTVQTAAGRRGYITMEYVAGGSLEQLIETHGGAVPVALVQAVLRQAAEGLAVAHERAHPIVHRDLSLANVLVSYDESGLLAKVSDFGLAKETDPMTMAASAQGTVAYMPPEVLRQGRGYSCVGDVWALGTIAYLLLTNHFPYDGGDPVRSFSLERFQRTLLPPSAFNDDVGPELDRLVGDMLRVDPGERTGSAREVARRATALSVSVGPPARGPRPEPDPPPAPPAPVAPPDPARAEEAEREALALVRLSHEPGRLAEAAERLAALIDAHPGLAARHRARLTTWRRGVVM